MQFQKEKDKVVIIDFGSQVTKLIGRNIRELGVYSEIVTIKEFQKIKEFYLIKGIIFSGGPSSVTSKNYQTVSKKMFQLSQVENLNKFCYEAQEIPSYK